jgi:glycosyltransferase involved in cell wall biosynthesis
MKSLHLRPVMQTRSATTDCQANAGVAGDASAAPRFSIITATFNARHALLITARSLQEQTCQSFEWLIVDGASTDDTLAVARGFGNLVTTMVSEPDTGIYNAWNKMLPHVSGQWVLFLGAGDALYAPDTLAQVAESLDHLPAETSTAYGDATVFDATTGVDLRVRSATWQGLRRPWAGGRPLMPCHQGVFQRAHVLQGFRFDERCRISADNETLLRELLAGHGAKLDVMVARFDAGGISAQPKNRLRMVSESVYINWKLGIFHVRPVYQVAVLLVNALLHPWRVWRTRRLRA